MPPHTSTSDIANNSNTPNSSNGNAPKPRAPLGLFGAWLVLCLVFVGCQERVAPVTPVRPEPSKPIPLKSQPVRRAVPRAGPRPRPVKPKPKGPWVVSRVIKRGDTLIGLMTSMGIRQRALRANLNGELSDFVDPRRIRPGHKLTARFHKDGRLDWLFYFQNPLNEWKLDVCWPGQPCYEEYDQPTKRNGRPSWAIETQKVAVKERIVRRAVSIKMTRETPNLTAAIRASGGSRRIVPSLIKLLGRRANLNRLYGGEKLHMVVERLRYKGKYYGYRNILFARFQRRKEKPITLLYHTPPGSSKAIGRYYRPDGTRKTKEQMFGVPIRPFRPGSRRFGMRMHPILRRRRMHWGVDFGAPCGRRLYAIAKGRVITRARRGGAGKMISIRHTNGWVARYMHLSRYGVRRGQRVRRGQYIGRVGTTGLSTGCHLHFELMRWGRHLDPLKVLKIRRRDQVPCRQMKTFWKLQLRACHSTGLTLQQCQLQLPRRCFRRHRRSFWRLAKRVYGSKVVYAEPSRAGRWPTKRDRDRYKQRRRRRRVRRRRSRRRRSRRRRSLRRRGRRRRRRRSRRRRRRRRTSRRSRRRRYRRRSRRRSRKRRRRRRRHKRRRRRRRRRVDA